MTIATLAADPVPEVQPTSRFSAQVAVGRTSCEVCARDAVADCSASRRLSAASLGARRAFFGPLTHLFNPLIRRAAGRAGVPLVGLVYHQGRRSGRTYTSPVAIRRTGSVFLIPLTFGASSDWCRNVLATGGCTIKWRGRTFNVDQPVLVDDVSARSEVQAAFNGVLRFMLSSMGTHVFLRLRAGE